MFSYMYLPMFAHMYLPMFFSRSYHKYSIVRTDFNLLDKNWTAGQENYLHNIWFSKRHEKKSSYNADFIKADRNYCWWNGRLFAASWLVSFILKTFN